MRRVARLTCGYLKINHQSKQTRSLFTNEIRAAPGLHQEWETPRETIFQALAGQQKRRYAPASPTTSLKECWNCKKLVENGMMCQQCNHLQDVNMDINYFDLMKFPQTFALENSDLTKRFRQLQTIVHPDKFSNKSSREQTNSADWSSLINKAYKTLLIPIDRAQYLLKLNGRQIPKDNSVLDKEFLMEMMERNEEVDDAETKQDLDEINERLTQELKGKVESLTKVFAANDFDAATSVMVEMKYLLSIQKTIKKKLQSLMGS